MTKQPPTPLDLAARWCNVPPVLPHCVASLCPKCHVYQLYEAERGTMGRPPGRSGKLASYICDECTTAHKQDWAERQAIVPGGQSMPVDDSCARHGQVVGKWKCGTDNPVRASRWRYNGECRDDV